MKTRHLLICLSGVMAFSIVAYADVDFGKNTPSTSQVINALNPDKANPAATIDDDTNDYEGDAVIGGTRSIKGMEKLNAPSKTAKTTITKPKIAMPQPKAPTPKETALSMEIIFGYNTAELTAAAKEQLKPVGEALASGKLQNLSFVIEGHTDAVGGQSYNKTLSEERAASVRDFLVSTFNLQSANIQIVGKGKNDLLDPNNPSSEVNRRVRIIARK
jgi:outer membrane protein OmpA-like peptidoglycan-associated protein